jgi:eukaryotic-like serine/threonine-protein kinase
MKERWQEIERIFNAAREIDETARAEYLAKACAGDDALRQEVERLLLQASQVGSFLETPAIEVAAEALAREKQLPDPSRPAVEPGAMVAHYRLAGKLGEGGMGEVYRARDTRLQRDVALKILPQAMARDAERMARFEREAQVLASLNHPNIAAIHGLEESNGIHALVMELVEGEALGEKIVAEGAALPLERGAVPYQDALPIAKQIAEALEYAHERGVIHRDLKPANVKITPEGAVKVLDFGLAKVLNPQDSSITADVTKSPTLSAMDTQPGMILGTAAYMSPEQARGQRVDRRCDIWAFGCVLFEMLSGRKAFDGVTISDVLAAVITKEPDWNALPETIPLAVQKLVHRCLQKDQRQRLQAIGDARITIEEALNADGDVAAGLSRHPEIGGVKPLLRRTLPWALAVIFAVFAAGLIVYIALRPPTAQSRSILSYIPPPPNTTFRDYGLSAGPVVISPAGKQLAFSATNENGVTRLYVRSLDSNEARAIAGTEDAAAPFWSPDGGSLGFFAGQKLKTVNLGTGNLQVLANGSSCGLGGSFGGWSPGGTILFTPRCNAPLDKISHSGGEPSPATKLATGEIGHGWPAFLPDGRHFLYASNSLVSQSIWIGSLDSGGGKLVLKDATSPEYASGDLLFLRNRRVFAQPMDPATGKLAGEATPLAEAQSYSVSASGVLAFQGGSQQGRLRWFDRNGNPLGTVGPVAVYHGAGISPDGAHILADVEDPQLNSWDLWSYPAAGGPGTRLTFGPGVKAFSVWSPDGKYIAYSCQSNGNQGVCRKPADGSGAEEKLMTLDTGMTYPLAVDWSPEGRYLSFVSYATQASRFGNWILPLLGNRKQFQVAAVSASQYGGAFSPDGRWLAYFSYETGRPEVYVVPFPEPGGKFQISQNSGYDPMWDKKGHLYFLSMGNQLMEADIEASGKSVQVKSIQPLFQLSLPKVIGPLLDVSADGSRFLVVTSHDPDASRSIGLLLNWQSKLKGKE